jgi:N-glycosidase YbiA
MIAGFFKQYRFLSNFVPAQVEFEGKAYPSVEHAYQAAKTLDLVAREAFSDQRLEARDAKRLGKKLTVRSNWEKAKPFVMLDLVRQKFKTLEYKEWLIATSPHELVEENWWGDRYWGVCGGTGENRLGKILMQVRAELVAES